MSPVAASSAARARALGHLAPQRLGRLLAAPPGCAPPPRRPWPAPRGGPAVARVALEPPGGVHDVLLAGATSSASCAALAARLLAVLAAGRPLAEALLERPHLGEVHVAGRRAGSLPRRRGPRPRSGRSAAGRAWPPAPPGRSRPARPPPAAACRRSDAAQAELARRLPGQPVADAVAQHRRRRRGSWPRRSAPPAARPARPCPGRRARSAAAGCGGPRSISRGGVWLRAAVLVAAPARRSGGCRSGVSTPQNTRPSLPPRAAASRTGSPVAAAARTSRAGAARRHASRSPARPRPPTGGARRSPPGRAATAAAGTRCGRRCARPPGSSKTAMRKRGERPPSYSTKYSTRSPSSAGRQRAEHRIVQRAAHLHPQRAACPGARTTSVAPGGQAACRSGPAPARCCRARPRCARADPQPVVVVEQRGQVGQQAGQRAVGHQQRRARRRAAGQPPSRRRGHHLRPSAGIGPVAAPRAPAAPAGSPAARRPRRGAWATAVSSRARSSGWPRSTRRAARRGSPAACRRGRAARPDRGRRGAPAAAAAQPWPTVPAPLLLQQPQDQRQQRGGRRPGPPSPPAAGPAAPRRITGASALGQQVVQLRRHQWRLAHGTCRAGAAGVRMRAAAAPPAASRPAAPAGPPAAPSARALLRLELGEERRPPLGARSTAAGRRGAASASAAPPSSTGCPAARGARAAAAR